MNAPAKFILTKAETWQFRRAQSVNPALARAVRRLCEASKDIRACYLLDTRKSEADELKLTIALSLDDEGTQMDQVAVRFQEMLRKFPAIAQNTAIMSAEPFERDYSGAKFYARNEGLRHSILGWLRRKK